jgi:hypothetical protein
MVGERRLTRNEPEHKEHAMLRTITSFTKTAADTVALEMLAAMQEVAAKHGTRGQVLRWSIHEHDLHA